MTWIVTPTAAAYIASTMTLQLIHFVEPTYTPKGYHGTLVMWGILGIALIFNTLLGALLPMIELLFLICHLIGFFAVIIPLLSLGPKGNAYELFTTFNNGGGWSSTTLSFFVGMQGNAAAILSTMWPLKHSGPIGLTLNQVAIALCT